jgi:hypothetical protein
MEREGLERIIRSRRTNAVLSWLLVGLVALVSLASIVRGELLWALFAATLVALAVHPALVLGTPKAMPPWEVVLFAALPTLAHLFATTLIGGQITTYLSVAALALLVAVDLDAFTPVDMNDSFAVLFVVITTMATAGIWAVVRWLADLYLATGFIESEHALMVEFVASTIAGVAAGIAFVFYFRQRTKPDLRVPEEVELP